MYDDRLELELFEDSPWYIPAAAGAVVAGAGVWWLMNRRKGGLMGADADAPYLRIVSGERSGKTWRTMRRCIKYARRPDGTMYCVKYTRKSVKMPPYEGRGRPTGYKRKYGPHW